MLQYKKTQTNIFFLFQKKLKGAKKVQLNAKSAIICRKFRNAKTIKKSEGEHVPKSERKKVLKYSKKCQNIQKVQKVPTSYIVSVLLFALVKRFSVTRVQDFLR